MTLVILILWLPEAGGAPAVPTNHLTPASKARFNTPLKAVTANQPKSIRRYGRGHEKVCLGVGCPGSQLHTILFFLQKLHGHHAILFETSIEFAAIDSQRRCCAHLIAAELLQD